MNFIRMIGSTFNAYFSGVLYINSNERLFLQVILHNYRLYKKV